MSVGIAFSGIGGRLFPIIGMRSEGAHIRANFGGSDFCFR
jgi:hypothetical protein